MKFLETDRLVLRQLDKGDADFILRLVNEPSWLRYIGDKGVRTIHDAERYIQTGPVDMYQRLGFGLWLIKRKPHGEPLGLCGLLKRDTLDDVDIGFALLPEYCKQGYAFEAASATLDFAHQQLDMSRVVAITNTDNSASRALLEKLGFCLQKLVRLSPDDNELNLFILDMAGDEEKRH